LATAITVAIFFRRLVRKELPYEVIVGVQIQQASFNKQAFAEECHWLYRMLCRDTASILVKKAIVI